MLEVNNLWVRVGGRDVVRGVDLSVAPGETVAIFGPNGSGKTTLLKALMGMEGYEATRGTLHFMGRDITALPSYERARMGMAMAFQRPPAIRGLKMSDLLSHIAKSSADTNFDEAVRALGLEGFLERECNLGFSGGEIKRTELLQLLAQGPTLSLFDEPDSGVDMESLTLVAQAMRSLLEKDLPRARRTRSGLIITHTGHILERVHADRAVVFMEGVISCSGNPREILDDIRAHGFKGCATCRR